MSEFAPTSFDEIAGLDGQDTHAYMCILARCRRNGERQLLAFSPSQMRAISGEPASCDGCGRTLRYDGRVVDAAEVNS